MEAVKEVKQEKSKILDLRSVTKEKLGNLLYLFIYSIRRVKMCGNREVVGSTIYYEVNLRNSGLWLSATAIKSPRFDGGVQYYISVSSDDNEHIRQWVNFDCDNSLAIVNSCSDDVSILVGSCEFLKADFWYILRQIEFRKDRK